MITELAIAEIDKRREIVISGVLTLLFEAAVLTDVVLGPP